MAKKIEYKTGDSIISQCCNCNKREVWVFNVIRGKTPQDDVVKIDIFNISDERNRQKNKLGVR